MYQVELDQSTWLWEQIRPYIGTNSKISGYDVNMSCPFCQEAIYAKKRGTKRGHYYINTQSYYCYRCDIWAHGIKLYAQLSGKDENEIRPEYFRFKYSSNNLTSSTALSSIVNKNEKVIQYNEIPKILKNALSDKAKEYLKSRKILESPGLPKDFKFYSAKNKINEFLVIPWYFNGEECYYQLRDIDNVLDTKYLFPKGLDKSIFNLDNIDTTFPYIICWEGVFDSILCYNGVALGGKALTEYQKWMLSVRYPRHKIVFALDYDKAGIDRTKKIIKDFPNYLFLNWFPYVNKCKDLNEHFCKFNKNPFYDKKILEDNIMSSLSMQLLLPTIKV